MRRGPIRYHFHMPHVFCTILLGLLLLATPVYAQQGDGGGSGGSEISLFLGSMLPNQIEGVTEILPVFGGRYGLHTSSVGVMEFGLTNAHAEGVDFTTFSGSLRADLPTIDQFFGLIYGGIDIHYYRPVNTDERKTETGLHVGSGLMMHVSNTLWLRTDLKFMAAPGTSLSIMFGFVFAN